MAIFSWANPKSIEIPGALASDRPLYIISDLHLGDGTRSDAFMGKDQQLLAFLQKVRSEGAHLVINGDALDFHQAWSFTRILRAHSELLGELSRMAETTGVTYIWGNHDYDIQLFKDILRFRVLSSLDLGTTVRIVHGYEFDPFIGPHLEQSHVATRIHHFVERITGAWIRLPLENFYSPANRFTFWLIFNLIPVQRCLVDLREARVHPCRCVGGNAGAVLDAEPARRPAVHLERRARLGDDRALHVDRHGALAHAGPRRGDAGTVLREHRIVDLPVVAVRVLGRHAVRGS